MPCWVYFCNFGSLKISHPLKLLIFAVSIRHDEAKKAGGSSFRSKIFCQLRVHPVRGLRQLPHLGFAVVVVCRPYTSRSGSCDNVFCDRGALLFGGGPLMIRFDRRVVGVFASIGLGYAIGIMRRMYRLSAVTLTACSFRFFSFFFRLRF